MPETATNTVSKDASLREAVPESQEQTAAVSEGEDASHSEAATAVCEAEAESDAQNRKPRCLPWRQSQNRAKKPG